MKVSSASFCYVGKGSLVFCPFQVFRWLMHNSFRAQKMHHLRIYLFLAAGVYLLVSEHIFNVVSMYFSNATET